MGILSDIFGTASKNPSVIGLAALGIGLFIFRDRISDFFSKITGGAEGAASIAETGGTLASNFQSFLTATPLPTDPLFGEEGIFTNLADSISNFKFPEIKLPEIVLPDIQLPGLPDIFKPSPTPGDFTDVGMAGARSDRGGTVPDIIQSIVQDFSVQSTIPGQQFQGGGLSFEGGVVRETPIANLSLSQIIDRFMVSASRAADIRAQAIGFTPREQAFLDQGTPDVEGFVGGGLPSVSDQQFQGLTPEEIALRLTGGVISNF